MPLMGVGQVNALRRVVASALLDACTIERGGVPLSPQPTMPDGSPLRCLVTDDHHETHLVGLPPLVSVRRWKVRLPYSVSLLAGDYAVTPNGTYVLELVDDPRTYQVQQLWHAYRLYDASGNWVLFPTNAVVTVLRRPDRNPATGVTGAPTAVAGLANIPIFVGDLANELKVGGIAAEYGLRIVFQSAYAIRDGDMLTGYNPLALERVPTLTVGHVDPTAAPGIPVHWALVKVQG